MPILSAVTWRVRWLTVNEGSGNRASGRAMNDRRCRVPWCTKAQQLRYCLTNARRPQSLSVRRRPDPVESARSARAAARWPPATLDRTRPRVAGQRQLSGKSGLLALPIRGLG
jgi:hypothetical protein